MVGQRRVLGVRHRSGEDDCNNDGDSFIVILDASVPRIVG